MIKLEHVQKAFNNGSQVLKDVNATINKGDVIAVIGPSGTGKSTLLRCINMLDGPTGGKIFLDGEEITAQDYPMEKVHRKVCMVFQSYNLFEHLTTIENIMLPQIMVLKKSSQEAYDYGMKLLSSVGMGQKKNSYPKALSGGQKQRVAIARTLAMDPEVILFDEPTSALDPSSVDEVKTVIMDVAKSGVTCLIVTHDMKFARQMANRVFYMDQGIIYEDGTPEEIFEHPKKERTIEFVKRSKSMTEEITGRDFDYPSLMSGISDYCKKNQLSDAVIADTQMVTEELVWTVLFGKISDPFRIRLSYEYDLNDRQMEITAQYSGKRIMIFDPDPNECLGVKEEHMRMTIRILRARLDMVGFEYDEEKELPNVVRMRLKRR